MLHTLNPFAIKLWGDFGIRWYGLAYLSGFICAYYIFVFMARRKLTLIPKALISDFVFTVAIGTIIGGRLGYCIFYSPDLFLRFNSHFPFWGVLAVNEGGMASHGGIIGIIVASLLFAKKHKFSGRHAVDLCALTGPVGVFFGRIANFVNGELVGRPCSENYSWCVKFPQDIFLWPTHEPERLSSLSAAVSNIGIQPETWAEWIKSFAWNRDSWHAVDSTLSSLVNAVQSHNLLVSSALTDVLTLRHPSQLYEALLEGLFLFVVLAMVWAKPRKPGVITGCFLTIYAIVRIIGENYRMPDAQIGFQALGLTRGQWLSIVMFGLGFIYLIWSIKQVSPKIGGWSVKTSTS